VPSLIICLQVTAVTVWVTSSDHRRLVQFVQLFVTVFLLVVVVMRLVYTFMYLADLHV